MPKKAATRKPAKTSPAKKPTERKTQFDPEQLESPPTTPAESSAEITATGPTAPGEVIDADFTVVPDGNPATSDSDAPLVPGNDKPPTPAKGSKPKKTAREKFLEQTAAEIKATEAAVCQAAMDERAAETVFKQAKSVHKAMVKRLCDLHVKLADPQGHLPLEGEAGRQGPPLTGQKELPLAAAVVPGPGTPDEWGLLKLSAAKAVVDGNSKKLPAGILEKLEGASTPVLTVTDLERCMAENRLQFIGGIKTAAIDKITDWLMAYRQEHPIPQPEEPAEESTTDVPRELVAAGSQALAAGGFELDELSDWHKAANALRDLLMTSDEVQRTAAGDATEFAESITRDATEMLEWITSSEKVTEAQATAIRNWLEGLRKWQPVAA